jgi:hypothetical protein
VAYPSRRLCSYKDMLRLTINGVGENSPQVLSALIMLVLERIEDFGGLINVSE